MAHRVSARYFGLKLGEALQAAAAAAQSSATASLSEALQRGMAGEDMRKLLCERRDDAWRRVTAAAARRRCPPPSARPSIRTLPLPPLFCTAYRARLTMPMLIGGAAMAPTLNPKGARCDRRAAGAAAATRETGAGQAHGSRSRDASPCLPSTRLPCEWCSQPDAVEHLLVRLLPRPSERSVFAGDVVAFTSPLTLAVAAGPAGVAGLPLGGGGAAAAAAADQEELAERLRHSAMVRRVAAMPGRAARGLVPPVLNATPHVHQGFSAAGAGGRGQPEVGLIDQRRRCPPAAGDELVTGEEEDSESFVVPEVRGWCWTRRGRACACVQAWLDSRCCRRLGLPHRRIRRVRCLAAVAVQAFTLSLLPPPACRATAGCWRTMRPCSRRTSSTAAALVRCRL